MHVHGEMVVGEASRYAGRASGRLSGHPKPMIIANVVAALATVVPLAAFSVLQTAFDVPAWLWLPAVLLSGAFGFWAGPVACRSYTVKVFRKNLAERGLASRFPSSFEITETAFVSTTGRMTNSAEWAAVSDIVRTDPYWVLLVEGHPQFLPRRFFASPAEEKSFLSEILARMSTEARARSRDAEAFVGV
jgi:hypothetical protein